MTVTIQISDSISPQLSLEGVERAAQETLDFTNAPSAAELTILLTNDEQLRDLNRQYLQIDAPTDVLSFPADLVDPETSAPYLGDILISYPRAQAQAEAGGHSPDSELQLLVVHGVLHLLGYDHAAPEEKDAMWAAQAQILDRLGIGQIRLPED